MIHNSIKGKLARIAGVVGLSAAMIAGQPLVALADQTINDNLVVNGSLIVSDFSTFAKRLSIHSQEPLSFEGDTIDGNKIIVTVSEPTDERQVVLPDADGEITLLGNSSEGTGSVVLENGPNIVEPVLNSPFMNGSVVLNASTDIESDGDMHINALGTSATKLILDNTNTGVASLDLSDGDLMTNATVRLSNAGDLKNINSISTVTGCVDASSPANCGSAMAGSVALPATATTLVVNNSAVTADSMIIVTEDTTLGSKLGITCQATIPSRVYSISAKTAGTSFTIRSSGAPIVNKACLNYMIIN